MDKALQAYIEKWNLQNVVRLDETPTSLIYKASLDQNDVILKIYTSLGVNCESDAPLFFEAANKAPVVPVIVYDDGAILLEFLPGKTLKNLVLGGQDDEATQIIGHVLKDIHQSPVPQSHHFENLERRFKALLNHGKDAPGIIKRGCEFARLKLQNLNEVFLLHGDMHHLNVIQDADKNWRVIDPQPLVGPRAYDAANTLHNPHQMPELTEDKNRLMRQVEILTGIMGVLRQDMIDYAYIHGCLSSCWTKMDDGHYGEDSLKTSSLLEAEISKFSS